MPLAAAQLRKGKEAAGGWLPASAEPAQQSYFLHRASWFDRVLRTHFYWKKARKPGTRWGNSFSLRHARATSAVGVNPLSQATRRFVTVGTSEPCSQRKLIGFCYRKKSGRECGLALIHYSVLNSFETTLSHSVTLQVSDPSKQRIWHAGRAEI